MTSNENIIIYESFLSPSERGKATNDLASKGELAIPILEALFNGKAKNKNGISYNKIGTLGCAYVTVQMLGDIAKPLEKYICKGILENHSYAIQASGAFSKIKDETIIALARALNSDPVSDAAYSLSQCGESNNIIVLDIIKNNPEAITRLKHAENYINKKT